MIRRQGQEDRDDVLDQPVDAVAVAQEGYLPDEERSVHRGTGPGLVMYSRTPRAEQRQPIARWRSMLPTGTRRWKSCGRRSRRVVHEDAHDGEVDDRPRPKIWTGRRGRRGWHDDVDDRDDRREEIPETWEIPLKEGGERVDAALAPQANRDPDRRDASPRKHEDAPRGELSESVLVWCCPGSSGSVTPPSLRRSKQGTTSTHSRDTTGFLGELDSALTTNPRPCSAAHTSASHHRQEP